MKKKKQRQKQTSKAKAAQKTVKASAIIKEWVGSLVFAFVLMLFVHMFIFQPFVVPTPSMAGTVLPGEYLIVSKLHYGAQTPRSLGIPYTDLYVDGISVPAVRLPGFSEIKRGDVVVFHYPPEIERPIDKRQPYLKRALGLPGENISIQDKQVSVDGETIDQFEGLQQFWDIEKSDARVNISYQKLKELGVEEVLALRDTRFLRIIANEDVAKEIATWSYIESVTPFVAQDARAYNGQLFPSVKAQTPDNYGPIWIPKAGESIDLNAETWSLYGETIALHEQAEIERLTDGSFTINGVPATDYTFDQDYYFMMGDNRDNSLDSRFWGFVPQDHIMGKAVARFYSWDKEAKWPRFNRMFQVIR